MSKYVCMSKLSKCQIQQNPFTTTTTQKTAKQHSLSRLSLSIIAPSHFGCANTQNTRSLAKSGTKRTEVPPLFHSPSNPSQIRFILFATCLAAGDFNWNQGDQPRVSSPVKSQFQVQTRSGDSEGGISNDQEKGTRSK